MAEAKKEAGLFQRVCHFIPGPTGERGSGINMTAIVDVEGGPRSRVAYGSGVNVWVRENEDHLQGFYYRGHHDKVKCVRWMEAAKQDHGGGWIMSGDDAGNWRVWTCREDEPVTKGNAQDNYGFKCAKRILDVAWQGDNKKVCVVGAGAEEIGKCAAWDTGNQFGIFKEVGATLLTVDTTVTRPYRCIMGGEAGFCYTYHSKGGKMEMEGSKQRVSKKYINCIRFHPEGEYAVAVGGESNKIFILNGRTGAVLHKVAYKNKGTLYSVSWNPDGTAFTVAGANKKVAIFNCELKYEIKTEKVKRRTITSVEFGDLSCELVAEYTVGKNIDDQQNSVSWASPDCIVSSSIFGDLTYLNAKGELIKTVSGHDTNIEDMATSPGEDGAVYTVSASKCIRYCMKDGTARRYRGNHGIVGRASPAPYSFVGLSANKDTMVTVAINDTFARTPVEAESLSEVVNTDGAVRWLCCGKKNNDLTILLAKKSGIVVYMKNEVVCTVPCSAESRAADISEDDSVLVVAMNVEDERYPKSWCVKYSVAEDGTLAEIGKTEPVFEGKIATIKLNPTDSNEAAVIYGNDTMCHCIDLNTGDKLTNSSINAVGAAQLYDVAWRPGSKTRLAAVGGNSCMAIIRKNTIKDPVIATRKDLAIGRSHYSTIRKCAWLTDEILVCADDVGAIAFWAKTDPLGSEE